MCIQPIRVQLITDVDWHAAMQTWDVNKPAPESLGGPFDLILASNAVHTCDNMAGAWPRPFSCIVSTIFI